jgi:uncharacterized protein involved in outer membrane biogenesis
MEKFNGKYSKNAIVGIFIVLLLFVVGLFVIPHFLTLNHLKSDIIAKIEHDLEVKVEIFGDVTFSILPSNKLILNNVKLLNNEINIEIPSLVLSTHLLEIAIQKLSISGIEVRNTQFTLESLDHLSDILNRSSAKGLNLLNNIRLHEVDLILNPQAEFLSKVQKISGEMLYQYGRRLRFVGTFILQEISYNMNIDLLYSGKQDGQSVATIKSDFLEMQIIGDMGHMKQKNFEGKMSMRLLNNVNINKSIPVLYKAFLNDNVSIESNFLMHDKQFEISNFKVSGDSISNMLGNANIVIGESHQISANLTADNMNFDTFLGKVQDASQKTNTAFSLESIIKQLLLSFNFDIADNIFGQLNIKIKELLYHGQPMKDLLLNSNLLEGKFVLSNFVLALPGDAKLHFQGVGTHNKIRPKFDGQLKLSINDYRAFNSWMKVDEYLFEHLFDKPISFQSNVSVMPRNMRFDEAELNWGELRVLGKLVLKYSGDDSLGARASLNINALDADSLNISRKWDEFITQLYAYDFDKTGESFLKSTGDFTWLRSFPVNFSIDTTVGQLKFKNMQFPKFFSTVKLAPNSLALEQMSLICKEAEITGLIDLNTAAITPKLTVDLVIPKIDVMFLDNLLPKYEHLITAQQKALSEYPENAELLTIGGANFFSLRNVVSDITLKIGHLISQNLKIHNIESHLSILDGIAHVHELQAKLFNGELKAIGSIVFNSIIPLYNMNFALNDFHIDELIEFYAQNSNFSGYASVSGSILSKGANVGVFYNNLSGNLQFIVKNALWQNFDIGEIVKLSEYSASMEEKTKVLESALSSGKSFFDSVEGNAILDKGILTIKDAQLSTPRISGAFSLNLNTQYRVVSHFTRLSFIPAGRRAVMSIDITGSGPIKNLTNRYNYQQYLQFLQNDPSLTNRNSTMEVVPNNLRNFR